MVRSIVSRIGRTSWGERRASSLDSERSVRGCSCHVVGRQG